MRTPWAVLLLVGLLAACDAPRTGPSATPTMVAASRVEIIGDGPVFEPAACAFPVPSGYHPDCGYMVVPENRGRPDSPFIRLQA